MFWTDALTGGSGALGDGRGLGGGRTGAAFGEGERRGTWNIFLREIIPNHTSTSSIKGPIRFQSGLFTLAGGGLGNLAGGGAAAF